MRPLGGACALLRTVARRRAGGPQGHGNEKPMHKVRLDPVVSRRDFGLVDEDVAVVRPGIGAAPIAAFQSYAGQS
jgi:hypothetical protein